MTLATRDWIGCDLSESERTVVDLMKAQGGFDSDANLLRSCLFQYALHFDLACSVSLFALRPLPRRRAHAPAKATSRKDRATCPPAPSARPLRTPEATSQAPVMSPTATDASNATPARTAGGTTVKCTVSNARARTREPAGITAT